MRRVRRLLAAGFVLAVAALAALAVHDRRAPRPTPWLAAAGLSARYVEVHGNRLRYVRAGSGPAVLLVHGFGSSLYTWKDVIPPLAAEHEVVAVDLPGFGHSARPARLDAEDLVRSVSGLMDRLAVRRAALVGNSMGGAVAALTAAQHPERTAALVLVDAAGFNLDPGRQPAFVRVAMSPLGMLLQRLPGRRLLVELGLRHVLHDRRLVTDERVAEYLDGATRPGSLVALRSLGISLHGRKAVVQDALAHVQAPTLVVWGSEDAWIPVADAARFAGAIAGARLEIIEDSGHLPQEEKPGELVRLLRAFLRDVEQGSRAAGTGTPRTERDPAGAAGGNAAAALSAAGG